MELYGALKKWHKKYGPVYTVWFGEIPFVMINDYETIVDTFQKDGDTFGGRMIATEYHTHLRGL